MKYYIIAETREKHDNLLNTTTIYNDYVSKKSMDDFADACCKLGYDCVFLGGLDSLYEYSKKNPDLKDVIFINYNYGFPAQYKRGQTPMLLEMLKANYSGADPLTSLVVNDKSFSKKIVKGKVNTPKSVLLFYNEEVEVVELNPLHYPVVVKPNAEGSSLGVADDSFCVDATAAIHKAKDLLVNYSSVLVEEYIEGFEVTVWIIGNKDNYKLIQPLVISTNGKYYFEAKIFTAIDKANHIRNYSLPENIFPNNLVKEIICNSKIVFEELGMRDYGRIDFRIFNNEIYFIEANALPIFSKTSEIGEITRLCNLPYKNICKMMIETVNSRLNVQN